MPTAPAQPPNGSLLDSPWAQRVAVEDQLGGHSRPSQNDPAFQPYFDPLKGGDAAARAKLVYRELPLITIQNSWTVTGARSALWGHTTGIFDQSAQLWDAITGDDRIQATMGSRIGGLFGRPVVHRPSDAPSVRGSKAAQECFDAWVEAWPKIASEASFRELHQWDIGMGFAVAQTIWDTSEPIWIPHVQPWHPRFMFYHWPLRVYVAITYDGLIPIFGGDGKWLLHAPYGEYRGWMRGVIRAVTEPWLLRHFAIRDWGRFSEVHGLPTRMGVVPASSDPAERSAFEQSLANLGSNTSMIVPQGVDGQFGYDYRLVEATDTAWESFPGLRDHCDMAIVLAILFQNLTTEVKEGSFAAARIHGDVRQGALEADNRALALTIHNQLARPFALYNFGDADLAPWSEWDVTPVEDYKEQASLFQSFGTAIEVLRRGGVEFESAEDVVRFAKSLGLNLPSVKLVQPVTAGGSTP